LVFMDWT